MKTPLAPFVRRLRSVRFFQGAKIGLFLAGIFVLGVAILDFLDRYAMDFLPLTGIAIGLVVISGLISAARRISENQLIESIDRRAHLEDRLITANEWGHEDQFADELRNDADLRFKGLNPKHIFIPSLKFREVGLLTPMCVGLILLGLGSSEVLLTPEAKAAKAELKQTGQAVERILRPMENSLQEAGAKAEEKRLVQELEKLQKKLDRTEINKDQALQKMDELSKEAKRLTADRSAATLENLSQSQTALAKMAQSEIAKDTNMMSAKELEQLSQVSQSEMNQKSGSEKQELQKQGLEKQLNKVKQQRASKHLSPEESKKLAQKQAELERALSSLEQQSEAMQKATEMSLEQMKAEQDMLKRQESAMKEQMSDLQKQLDQVKNQQNNPNLSPEQQKKLAELQKKLEAAMKGLEKEMAELQKAMETMMQSQKIKEMMEQLQKNEEFQKLQEMAQKLQEEAMRQEMGEPPQMTKEQIQEMMDQMDQMQDELEALAEQLQDPEAMKEFIEQMKEALKNAQAGQGLGLGMGLGMGMMPGMGMMSGMSMMPGMGSPGGPGGDDRMLNDTGKVRKSEKEQAGAGKTLSTGVKGQRRNTGKESFVEVRGPSMTGNRTSVPYSKVLPSYKKKAEQAIQQDKIPKQHQKRVKSYFDSLGGK